jgi:hypothetical protein
MRDELLTFVKGLSLGTIAVSNDLPFDDGGTALYLKNAKRIYVDRPQKTTDAFIQTLDSTTINNETTTISVYFSTDAKQTLANYDTIVDALKTAKDITTITGINRREVDVSSEYEGDMMVTQIDYRYSKILT